MKTSDALHTSEVYSKSLFELAENQQLVEAVKNDFDALNSIINSDKDLWAFLISPGFSFTQKKQLIEKACAGFDALTLNFLFVMLAHNKTQSLPYIIEKYEKLYKRYNNFYDIKVTVSRALNPDETQDIKSDLAKAVNSEKILLETSVDPAIMGGIIIRYDGQIIDNSIRGRLYRAVETVITRGKNREKIYET